jgi:hypothetical protein
MKPSTTEHIAWMQEQYKEMFVQILNQAALLEDKIDELITICFFEQTQIKWQFGDIILGDMILSQKIGKLQRTLKTLQPEIHQDFQQQEVEKRFNKVRKIRNIFAHSVLDTSPDYASKLRKDEIALFNFRYNPPHAQIIFEKFEKVIIDAQEIFKILENYSRQIRTKANNHLKS